MHILRPHPETLGVGPTTHVLSSPPGESDACKSLRTSLIYIILSIAPNFSYKDTENIVIYYIPLLCCKAVFLKVGSKDHQHQNHLGEVWTKQIFGPFLKNSVSLITLHVNHPGDSKAGWSWLTITRCSKWIQLCWDSAALSPQGPSGSEKPYPCAYVF